jgi:hypothetical protein
MATPKLYVQFPNVSQCLFLIILCSAGRMVNISHRRPSYPDPPPFILSFTTLSRHGRPNKSLLNRRRERRYLLQDSFDCLRQLRIHHFRSSPRQGREFGGEIRELRYCSAGGSWSWGCAEDH